MDARKLSRIEQKNKIYTTIKLISDFYSGDDIEWLREYAKEVIAQNKDDLGKALKCFEDLTSQLEFMPRRQRST